MIITCEKCGKSFKLDDKLLKPGGTKLQCSKCKHIFRAFPPGEKVPVKKPAETELITCEQCGAGFNMKSSLLKPDGSKVRCSKCKHIFLAYPSSVEPPPKRETPPAKAPEPEPEPELDLEIDETPEAEESDDLDLSMDEDDGGLDLDLDIEEDTDIQPSGASGDMELSLDDDGDDDEDDELDLETEPSGASGDMELSLDDDEDDEDDMELGLDDDESDEDVDADDLELSLDDDESEELDFSEVDSLLDADDDTSVMQTVEVSKDDLDFNLGLDEDDGAGGSIQQQEIDLADLEQTIEMELLEPDDDSGDEEPEDVELELADDDEDEDLDEEMDLGDEEDFSDIEEMLAVGEDEETIELDLDGDEEEEEEEEVEAGEETVVKGKKGKKQKKEKKKKEKKKKEKKKKKKEGEKSSKKGLIIGLIIVLTLIALGAGGYWYIETQMGGISSLLGGGEKAVPARSSGEVIVMENTLQSDFVNNAKHGKLFIIKGSVKNESPEPKRFIKVAANLYSEGHKLEMTSSAYCGNILTNEDLATRDLAGIDARLAVKNGDSNKNANVKPGMTIPFMVVIPQLPENLVEYEVVVSGSSPVA